MLFRGVQSPRLAQLALAALIGVSLTACGDSGSPSSSSAVGGANPFASLASPTGSSPTANATATNKSVTLSWSAPTQNSDGSSIRNLAGYTLHYGTSSEDYTGSIQITTPTATSYTVSDSNFPAGTYYFAISAYNAQQVSSSLSSEISVTVD